MANFLIAISFVLAFLLGAIPFGLLVSKIYSVDIRQLGSGNIGATNVYRNLGKTAGIATFLFDILKGVIAILISDLLLSDRSLGWNPIPLVGFFVILGHCFSPFLGGKGGKGVATSFGVFLYLIPQFAVLAFGLFVIVFYFSRYVSLASLMSSLLLLALTFAFEVQAVLQLTVFLSVSVIIFRHKDNIGRLIAGKENRFSRS